MSIKKGATGWNIQRVSTHPGDMLRDEFLTPLNLSQNALAMRIRVSATRIGDIVNGKRGITPDTALRLGQNRARPSRSMLPEAVCRTPW
jgi:addiction module HigA family antidote